MTSSRAYLIPSKHLTVNILLRVLLLPIYMYIWLVYITSVKFCDIQPYIIAAMVCLNFMGTQRSEVDVCRTRLLQILFASN